MCDRTYAPGPTRAGTAAALQKLVTLRQVALSIIIVICSTTVHSTCVRRGAQGHSLTQSSDPGRRVDFSRDPEHVAELAITRHELAVHANGAGSPVDASCELVGVRLWTVSRNTSLRGLEQKFP